MDDSETMNEGCTSYTLYGKNVDECPTGTNTNAEECSCHCATLGCNQPRVETWMPGDVGGCICACPDSDLATKCATGGDAESITHWDDENCTCECMLGSPGATDKCPPNMKNGYDGENPDTCKCVCDEDALECTADQTAVQGEDGCECGCDGKRMSVADADCTSSHENKYFIQDTCSCDCVSLEHGSNYACNNGMMEINEECDCVCKELECTGNRVTTLTEGSQCLCQCADQVEAEKWTSLDMGQWDADNCVGSCMNSGTSCPSPQTFNQDTCQCECNDVACGDVKKMVTNPDVPGQCSCECPQSNWEIYNCNRKDSSMWNESTCECECFANAYSGQIDCGPGSEWNPSACDCLAISTRFYLQDYLPAGSTSAQLQDMPAEAVEGATAILSPNANISETRTISAVSSGSDNPGGEIQEQGPAGTVSWSVPTTQNHTSVIIQSEEKVYHRYLLHTCPNSNSNNCPVDHEEPIIYIGPVSISESMKQYYIMDDCCYKADGETAAYADGPGDITTLSLSHAQNSMTDSVDGTSCCSDPHVCTFFGEKYDM
jgi:hypothetical protein